MSRSCPLGEGEMEMHDHDRESYAIRLGLPPDYKVRTVAKPCDVHAVLVNVSTVEVETSRLLGGMCLCCWQWSPALAVDSLAAILGDIDSLGEF